MPTKYSNSEIHARYQYQIAMPDINICQTPNANNAQVRSNARYQCQIVIPRIHAQISVISLVLTKIYNFEQLNRFANV